MAVVDLPGGTVAVPFLITLLVLSRKSVSLGDILWNTTF